MKKLMLVMLLTASVVLAGCSEFRMEGLRADGSVEWRIEDLKRFDSIMVDSNTLTIVRHGDTFIIRSVTETTGNQESAVNLIEKLGVVK